MDELDQKSQKDLHLPQIGPNRLFYPKPTPRGRVPSPNPYRIKVPNLATVEFPFPIIEPEPPSPVHNQSQTARDPLSHPLIQQIKQQQSQRKVLKKRVKKSKSRNRAESQRRVGITELGSGDEPKSMELSNHNHYDNKLWKVRVKKEENFRNVLVVERQRATDTLEYKIKSILKQVAPETTEKEVEGFINKFQEASSLIKKLKSTNSQIHRFLQSERHSSERKLEVLSEKKKQVEAEIEDEYRAMWLKYFRGEDDNFILKLRRDMSSLSRGLLN